MPFIYDSDDEELKQNPELSGESGAITSGSAPAPQAGKEGGPTRSGSFVNIQQYLGANADQSPSTALVDRIGNEGQQAEQALQQASSQFDAKAQQSATPLNKDLVDQAFADPVNFSKNEEQRSEFEKQRDNQYKGPTSLNEVEGFQPTQGQNVKSTIDQTGTAEGQFSLLQRYLGRPNYTRGETNLDQMIMQRAPKSREDFSQLGDRYGQIEQQYRAQEQAAQQKAQQYQAQAQQGSQYVRETGANREKEIENALNSRLEQATQQKVDRLAELSAAAKGLKAAPLGVRPDRFWNLDLNSYIRNTGDPQLATIATPEEQARYQALNSLLGEVNTTLPDATAAGTYDLNKVAYFDQNKFNTDRTQAERAFNERLANTYPVMPGLGGSYSDLPIMDRMKAVGDAVKVQQTAANDGSDPHRQAIAQKSLQDLREEFSFLSHYLDSIRRNAGYYNQLG